jgi:hypothetical protein
LLFIFRLIKTISKPIASRIKIEARRHSKFSKFCIVAGQFSHQLTSRINVIASGYKVLTVNPLPEEDALMQGIDFLTESFLVSFAAGIVIFEWSRNEAKNALKAKETTEAEANFKSYIEEKFNSLTTEMQKSNSRIAVLEDLIMKQVLCFPF